LEQDIPLAAARVKPKNGHQTKLPIGQQMGEYGELEEKEKGGGGSDDTVSNLEKGVSTQPGDFRLIPAYHDEAKLNRQYNVGTQAAGEVFDESWKRIKADPAYNKKGISIEEKNAVRNKHMKEVAKELFERNKK